MKVIETQRLLLRPVCNEDLENLFQVFADPVVMEFYPRTRTKQEIEEWIEEWQEYYVKYQKGFLACELKETGEFVGVSGVLSSINIEGQEEVEVGYLFIKKHWGKGFATESSEACLDYGFNTLGYERLVFFIHPHNDGSIHVAEKNGLKREKEVAYREGRALMFSITKEAFNARFLAGVGDFSTSGLV